MYIVQVGSLATQTDTVVDDLTVNLPFGAKYSRLEMWGR